MGEVGASTADALLSALSTRPLVVDGGLGTLLTDRGADVAAPLWSAQTLLEQPDEILGVHRDYFSAGADVAVAASYQVSESGFAAAGRTTAEARRMLVRSVELAAQARDEAGGGWVAASIGPYGASLADGSEYRGDDDLTVAELRAWHHDRLRILADAGADLLAIETIPSLREVEALVAELDGAGVRAWLAVTPDGERLRTGEPLADAFGLAAASDRVIAVGVNCCPPEQVLDAVRIARSVTSKPVVAYPNSGETWDAVTRTWHGSAGFDADLVRTWRAAGAGLIGGCCRTTPTDIAAIAEALA
ncbi:homocysteine S-methyltransferase [Agromyces sp. CF514]|uniref:homocysteine S-methyltransferase n=1 Tax=Agromyces sp. CF514 TaxID=1881031 RepID=UPI0008E9A2D2|nr:homocysteine S-methyltransferase [Agromyces sp. CF514]SFR87814.1 homocysteine S-methyltransferase [Agromyces sp. CF514]